jgi:Zinc finger C-x8-C-x5-C-x3-H type (and similar)
MADNRNSAGRALHKTELCHYIAAQTTCKYGDKCHFIHDIEEARKRPDKLHRKPGPGCVAYMPLVRLPKTSLASLQHTLQAT